MYYDLKLYSNTFRDETSAEGVMSDKHGSF